LVAVRLSVRLSVCLSQSTLFSWQHVSSVLRACVMDKCKTVRQGAAAHDADVVELSSDGVTRPVRSLLKHFHRPPRPLVLVFGSCS